MTLWLSSACWLVLYWHCFITLSAWNRSNPLCDRVNKVDLPLPVITYKIHHPHTQCNVSATCTNNEYNVVNFEHFAPLTASRSARNVDSKRQYLKHTFKTWSQMRQQWFPYTYYSLSMNNSNEKVQSCIVATLTVLNSWNTFILSHQILTIATNDWLREHNMHQLILKYLNKR